MTQRTSSGLNQLRCLLLVFIAAWLAPSSAATFQRVVSLAPSLTELVCALDACQHLVGIDNATDWPPRAREKPRVGDLYAPDLETILTLQPDLVLSTPYGGAALRLRQLGMKVVTIATDHYQDLYQAIDMLGELLGQVPSARRLAMRLRDQVARIASSVATLPRPRVYYEIDRTPYTAGGQSYVSTLIEMAGGENIAAAFPASYPRISPEFVLDAAPGVIILADAPHGVSAAEIAARPGWSNLPAVRDNRICALKQTTVDVLHRPGPRIGTALSALAECLHPNLNPNSQS